MSPTTILPQHQYNALPYTSTQAYAANGGQVQVRPGSITRYFTPAETGIDGVAGNASDPIDPAHPFAAIGKALDCQGCNRFTFGLSVKMQEAANDTPFPAVIEVYSTAWIGAEPGISVEPKFGAMTNRWALCGRITVNNAYIVFPGPGINPPATLPTVYKSGSCSWDVGNTTVGGNVQRGMTGPITMRIRCSGGVGGVPTWVEARIYGSLWASS
jgi:hypothetical protein